MTSLLDLLISRGNEVQGISLGLDRIQAVSEALGNPHHKYAVLHIAGTNGKGSVAAMAESILRHSGCKTGLFTSPHLVRLEERIRVRGKSISAARLVRLAREVEKVERKLLTTGRIDRLLTYFEFVTACGLKHFAEERVELAVVEVGLGGRLDATNIVHPEATVITGIAHDHGDLLGATLAAIASEKAGILKPGAPLVTGCRNREARTVILREARKLEIPVIDIDRDCRIRVTAEISGRCTLNLSTPRRTYRNLRLALAGEYQARNAAMAVAAVESLGVSPGVGAVRTGLARTRWPGRLDLYRARRPTLLEGAHNSEGARMLRRHLGRHAPGEIHLVFAAMRDKDILEIGRILFPLARTIHLAELANSRAADPAEIARVHARFRSRIVLHAGAREALEAAWERASETAWVVVTGSLYLVGALLQAVTRDAARIAARKGAHR